MDFQAQRENTMTVEKVWYTAKNRITGGWKNILMNHPLLHVVCVFLPAAQAIPTAVQAQVKAAPPIPGVLWKTPVIYGSSERFDDSFLPDPKQACDADQCWKQCLI